MKNLRELNGKELVSLNGGTAGVVADENGNGCTDHGTSKIKIGYGSSSNLQ